MKKMLLLLVSGLLIVCMGGSAIAGADLSVSDTSVNISENTFVPVSLSLKVDPGTYTLKLDPRVDGIQAYILADPEYLINVGSVSDLISHGSLPAEKIVTFTTQSKSYQNGTLYLKGVTGGDVKIYVFNDNGDQLDFATLVTSVTVTTNPIPEFPTIALPVAALIGLVFIFGRKKEGM